MKVTRGLCLLLALLLSLAGIGQAEDARMTILTSDQTNPERNRLLAEDIRELGALLPQKHVGMFDHLTEADFAAQIEALAGRVDALTNAEVFTGVAQILARIQDAHTGPNYWDGYLYPLQFYLFGGDVYVTNADEAHRDMLYQRVTAIDGVPMETVMERVETVISHENEFWVQACIPRNISRPIVLGGLGLLSGAEETIFTIERDGEAEDHSLPMLHFTDFPPFVLPEDSAMLGNPSQQFYTYTLLPEENALLFAYNRCKDDPERPFKAFAQEMQAAIMENDIDALIVDLRSNTGGDSGILEAFTGWLWVYARMKPEMQVYILTGRNTFSSGVFAILSLKKASPTAVIVGEATGGAVGLYGDVRQFTLSNSGLPISYSTRFFDFSKFFSDVPDDVTTYPPDVAIEVTLADYREGHDPVLAYVLGQ